VSAVRAFGAGVPPARDGYDQIPLYAPSTGGDALVPCTADLSDTVNLWGAPPAALVALREAGPETVSTYPALYNAELKAPIAAYAGVRPEEVVTGCGSDDVIDCALRAFAAPGGVVAHAAPTFSMVPSYARANGLVPVGVPLRGRDYRADADALLATGAAVIYLCTPNNPTSTPLPAELVRRVVEGARGLVLLDEAYA
jgi:histidinol-phosphate aminotransferase